MQSNDGTAALGGSAECRGSSTEIAFVLDSLFKIPRWIITLSFYEQASHVNTAGPKASSTDLYF